MNQQPVIVLTDLYHPHQDRGDNFDLLTPYSLPEIDLRGVILDITEEFRWEGFEHPLFGTQVDGPREPGVIPVSQCNYLFGKNVPYGISPFRLMNSTSDKMEDASPFHNAIPLLLSLLEESNEPVHLLIFGSARVVAAAYCRNPELLRQKVARIHLCAGASGDYLEWNVVLDPHAFVTLLRSDLPIDIYPCATKDGPFDIGEYNTFWRLPDLAFVQEMDPPLRRYLTYAFEREGRSDFLRYLLEEPVHLDFVEKFGCHNVWETAVWMKVAGRTLQNTQEGYRYLSEHAGIPALVEEMLPCQVQVADNGIFQFTLTDQPTNFRIYHRQLPDNLVEMLSQGLSSLYLGYKSILSGK